MYGQHKVDSVGYKNLKKGKHKFGMDRGVEVVWEELWKGMGRRVNVT